MIRRLGRMPGNGKLRREQRGRDCPPVWMVGADGCIIVADGVIP